MTLQSQYVCPLPCTSEQMEGTSDVCTMYNGCTVCLCDEASQQCMSSGWYLIHHGVVQNVWFLVQRTAGLYHFGCAALLLFCGCQKVPLKKSLCLLQFNVAQVNNTGLAAQAQPQPATPWDTSPIGTSNLAASAHVISPSSSAAFKESWFSGGARWCKPSNQDAVTGPGELSSPLYLVLDLQCTLEEGSELLQPPRT